MSPMTLPVPALGEAEARRLRDYVDRFNARDFDAIRAMLADDVRLDLVNRLRSDGRGRVGEYFHKYASLSDWTARPGIVDGRPAVLMFDPNDPGSRPRSLILLGWRDDSVVSIRDFHFARYVLETAELHEIGA